MRMRRALLHLFLTMTLVPSALGAMLLATDGPAGLGYALSFVPILMLLILPGSVLSAGFVLACSAADPRPFRTRHFLVLAMLAGVPTAVLAMAFLGSLDRGPSAAAWDYYGIAAAIGVFVGAGSAISARLVGGRSA